MNAADDDLDPPPGFFQRHGFLLGVGGIVLVLAFVFASQIFSPHRKPLTRAQQVSLVRLLPAPPPPPPPPPPPKLEEPKMIEQQPVDDQEAKPDDKPKDAPVSLGTNIKGDGGSDAFGLPGGGGGGIFNGGGSGRRSGRWGWYAGEVQTAIAGALRKNAQTRTANFRVEVRVWSDSVGRIVRARLGGTTGDARLDETIRSQVLLGLQLQDPPPPGMPMPIVMRLTARRPD